MEIVAVEHIPRDELLAAPRTTRLQGFDGAQPYADAPLELAAVDPNRLAPAPRYVLRPGVEKVLELRDTLLEHGVDIFALDGGVRVRMPDEVIPVLPPIVEES